MSERRLKPVALTIGSFVVASLGLSANGSTEGEMFEVSSVDDDSLTIAGAHKEGGCGEDKEGDDDEGSCGEGNCGEDGEHGEGDEGDGEGEGDGDGEDGDHDEGSCGEGNCGEDHKEE